MTRKFKFRLERIRRFKEQDEEDKKRKLAIEQSRLSLEKKTLNDFLTLRSRYLAKFGVKKTGRVNLTELILSKRYLDKLSADIVLQTKRVDGAEKSVALARKALLEASREKKKYDKLKEKQLDKYRQETNRSLVKELDEFGSKVNSRIMT